MQLLHHPVRAVTLITTGFLLTLGMLGATQAAAQDMTTMPHPAHIHQGSCAELGDVIHPLTDVGGSTSGTPTAGDMTGTPATGTMMASPTSMDAMASPSPMAGEMSVTTVEASLSDLAAGGYAINVHESAENIGNYIACGDITGSVTGEELTIQLEPLNDSGYSGTALLQDNGDGTTMVTITLMHGQM